ncbi:50S ribosomal protein L11 methyltransferase [Endothiovibrio diazotrophicus]
MPWLQLTLEVDPDTAERAEEALLEAGALSVTLSDGADQPLFEPPPGTTPLWRSTRVIGLFEADGDIEAAQAIVAAALPHAPLRLEALEDRDWVRAWMDNFKPMRFGERLWVVPGGFEPEEPEAVNLHLDPGLAFGTGTHPTTALCLEWLDAHPPQGLRVIDYGCGSGILAVAALLLGASEAVGVDNDPQALTASRDNAAKNGVDARLTVLAPEAPPPQPAAVVVANILAGPLIELAPRIASLVRPGGALVLSGILARQAEEVSAAYRPWFEMAPPASREEWVRLEGQRTDRDGAF